MKLFIAVAALISMSTAGRLDSNYLPPTSGAAPSQRINTQQFASVHSGPTAPPPAIIRLNNDNEGDGSYKFDFETENRISQQESGQLKNAGTDQETNVIQGSYSYTGPDGVVYTVNYIADEYGFRATGDHIPTAAPIPQEIAESLQKNAADEAAGLSDDGQYRPEPAGVAANRQYIAPNANKGYKY